MIDLKKSDKAYWIFPVEPTHRDAIRQVAQCFFDEQDTLCSQATREELVRSLNGVIDAGFYYYYTRPKEYRDMLSPLVRKAADSVVATMRGGIHLVVQRVFNKMTLDELKKMACYMDSMLITNPDNTEEAFVAYPLNEELRQQFAIVMDRISQEETTDAYADDLAELIGHVISQSAYFYYTLPTGYVRLNRLSKKAADFGIETVVKAAKKLTRRVVKDISHEDVALLPTNLHLLIATYDVPYSTCSVDFIEDKCV